MWGFGTIASLLYFGAGVGVALLPLGPYQNGDREISIPWLRPLSAFLFFGLLIYCLWRAPLLLAATPLDYIQADMLPVIRIMGERWLNGSEIYVPIEEIWAGMRPIYLPAMWLPYAAGVWLATDIRWISVVALLLSTVIIFWGSGSGVRVPRIRAGIFGLLPLGLILYYIFGLHHTLLTLSEEPVVIFYYLLLALALFRQWPLLTGVAMALCLLSRYALIFWVPVYLVYQYFYQSRKAAFSTLLALVISLTVVISLGRAWDELDFFLQLQGSYLGELLDADKRWAFITRLETNPGLVKFLPFDRIGLWHRALIYGSFLLPLLSLLLYRRHRTSLDARFFGLCSLKLSLVYFFNMLTIPYSYLFYPSTFLSLFLLFAYLPHKNDA